MAKNDKAYLTDDIEYFVDSRYQSQEEYDSEAKLLMEARLKRLKSLPQEEIIYARLMQLKLQLEDFLKNLPPTL